MEDFKLPPQAQLIKLGIYAVIGIIIIIFLVLALRWVASKLKRDDLVRESKKTVKQRNLSYDDFVYKQMASSIFEAADGIGTDEDTIYRNLEKLNNSDDYRQLIAVYGKDEDGFNLVSRLIYELDKSEQRKVNEILGKFNESI